MSGDGIAGKAPQITLSPGFAGCRPGGGRPGDGAGGCRLVRHLRGREDEGGEVRHAPLAAADLQQGSHDGTDHVAEETVCADPEICVPPAGADGGLSPFKAHQGDMRGGVWGPERFRYGAYRRLDIRSRLFEAGEIVPALQQGCGPVHRLEIQFPIPPQGIILHEGVLQPMQKVCIFAL